MPQLITPSFGENTHQVVPLRARVGNLMRRAKTAVEDKVNGSTWLDVIVVLSKYGVGSVLAIWLVYSMTSGLQVDVRAVQAEARGIRGEHVQMGMYLQGICYGVNKSEERWRCRAADAYVLPEGLPPAIPAPHAPSSLLQGQ
jgi:hypothetical protein